MERKKIAIRIDDIFSSSKQFEVYGIERLEIGGHSIPVSYLSNFLFLKYVPGLSKRYPYPEIRVSTWWRIFEIIHRYNVKITLGVTACWVEKDGTLRPFFEKFPEEAQVLKEELKSGFLEIANHGLTHCVVGKHRPRLFSSNRIFHREFWEWLPKELHEENIRRSQELLSGYFGCPIVTFIPPGNVWTQDTERSAFYYGLKYLSSREPLSPTNRKSNGLLYIGDMSLIVLHDRDLVLNGLGWFENLLLQNKESQIITVRELGIFLNGDSAYAK